jgi:hypothetical protein
VVEVYTRIENCTVDDIEQRPRSIAQDAARLNLVGEKAAPVGILRADHRDRWTEVHPFTFSVRAAAQSS